MYYNTIRDLIHSDIILTDEEMMICNTSEMRRLSRLNALGFVNLVYPCTNHTRFEHSLGVLKVIDDIIRLSGLPINDDDKRVIRICALLHDISHMPYSHVPERLTEIGYKMPHHDGPDTIKAVLDGTYRKMHEDDEYFPLKTNIPSLRDIIDSNDRKKIIEIIADDKQKKPKYPVLQELISGHISADILDYLKRDSFYLGLPYGKYDDRILSSFIIAPSRDGSGETIGFEDAFDSRHAVISVLSGRCSIFRQALRHHTSMIADRMFFEVLHYGFDVSIEKNEWKRLFIYGDSEFINYLEMKANGIIGETKIDEASILLNDLKHRRLYKRGFMSSKTFSPSTIDKVSQLREENYRENRDLIINDIKKKLRIKLEFHELLMDSPYKKSKWKEGYSKILIGTEGNTLDDYALERSQLENLKHQYGSLETLGVYYRPKMDETDIKVAKTIQDYCEDELLWKGYHHPKPSMVLSYTKQRQLKEILREIGCKWKWAIPLINIIRKNPTGLSRSEISVESGWKESTVSMYIGRLEKEIKKSNVELFEYYYKGGVKRWKTKSELSHHLEMIL